MYLIYKIIQHQCPLLTGLAALAKVLIAMEERTLPANLHYDDANPDIPGLTDGRLTVVAQNTPWTGGYVDLRSIILVLLSQIKTLTIFTISSHMPN